jgi:hypothetical protein
MVLFPEIILTFYIFILSIYLADDPRWVFDLFTQSSSTPERVDPIQELPPSKKIMNLSLLAEPVAELKYKAAGLPSKHLAGESSGCLKRWNYELLKTPTTMAKSIKDLIIINN